MPFFNPSLSNLMQVYEFVQAVLHSRHIMTGSQAGLATFPDQP